MLTLSRLASFLIVSVVLLSAACNRPQDLIVGKWRVQTDTGGIVWEFAPDGRVTTGDTIGRYTFGDRSRIKIQTRSATFVYEVQLKDDTMIWREPNGSRTELRRVP